MSRKACSTDVSDEEWEFVAPCPTLLREDAAQRIYPLCELSDAVRWIVKAGCPWRILPNDLPPWTAVQQQAERWRKAGCFEAMVRDLRELPRLLQERSPRLTAAILDGRTLQSSPESVREPVTMATNAKRQQGACGHRHARPPLGRADHPSQRTKTRQIGELARQVQEATQRSVKLIFCDQGYTGAESAEAATGYGIKLEVIKLAEAKRGFMLLPRRLVVERSFAWLARFRCLSRDYERLPTTLAGLHWLAFARLPLSNLFKMLALSA